MPCYNPAIPCLNQLSWPSFESILSPKFLKNYTLKDKVEQYLSINERIRQKIAVLQQKDSTIDERDFEIMYEIPNPDSNEAMFLNEINGNTYYITINI